MLIYLSTLLEDFAERGRKVIWGALQASDVARLSGQLMVVASGRGSSAEMFRRDSVRSSFNRPQRLLTGSFCRGLDFPDPPGVIQTIAHYATHPL